MKAAGWVFLFWVLATAQAASAESCLTLDEARLLFRSGSEDQAIAVVRCRLGQQGQQGQDSGESQRTLSDFYWWRGESDRGAAAAQAALSSPTDHETRAVLERRIARTKLIASYETVAAENDRGTESFLEIRHRYKDRNEFALGFRDAYRNYREFAALRDQSFQFGHLASVSRKVTIDTKFSFSSSPVFLPRWSVDILADYFADHDRTYTLGARTSFYDSAGSSTSASLVQFGFRMPFWEKFVIRERIFVLVAPVWLLSAAFTVEYWPTYGWGLSLSGSSGQSFEGPELIDRFHLYELSVQHRFARPVSLRLYGSRRTGELRIENRAGLGAEWSF